jgi:hypothetical protein
MTTNTEFYDIDTILDHYITCALWSSTEGDEGTPMDSLDAELAPEAKEAMRKDCAAFVALIDELGIDATQNWGAEQLGHDLWLTRNGHGAGFWDRGHDEGDALASAARSMGQCDLYLGDDGAIYMQ